MRSKKIFLFVLISILPIQAFAKKIVIIGAGLAGLTTAYDLQKTITKNKLDHTIEIYEAKNRAGGRVFTVMLDGKPVELGGQNLNDGGDALVMHRLIKEMGLKTQDHMIDSKGEFYYDEETKTKYDIQKDLAPHFPVSSQEELEKILTDAEKSADNLMDVLDSFFKKFKTSDATKKQKFAVIKRAIINMEKNYEGGDLEDLSPRYAHGSLPEMMGQFIYDPKAKHEPYPHTTVKGGNSKLIQALINKLGARIHYQRPLKAIATNKAGGFDLTLGDEKVEADIVVLTMPASVYKNIDFGSKTIPSDTLRKIKKIGYGTHAKILFTNTNKDMRNFGFLGRDLYIWTEKPSPWTTFYYSGDAGIMKGPNRFKEEYLRAHTVIGQKPKEIGDIPIATEMFSKNKTALAVSWALDPYTLGSYSYYTADLQKDLEATTMVNGEAVIPMFKPIEQKIYFAGEHTTTEQDIRGTMEAAAESGAKAARMIITDLKK